MPSRQHNFIHCKSAVDCLRTRHHQILRRWEDRARKELPAAAETNHFHLLNSLPSFLNELAESLEKRALKRVAMKNVAQSHASQRITLEGYSLEQVQAEYTILRKVIFELLEESATIDIQERNIILDFLAEGRMAASIKYMELAQNQIGWGKEHLSLALESAEMGTFDWDIQCGKVVWSDTLIRISGFSQGEFTGKIEDFWPRVHPEDRERLQQYIDESLKKKQDYKAEYRMIWADGSIHWYSAKGRTYFDQNGKAIRMLGTAFEITERKQMEENLKFAHQKALDERSWFEAILDWVPTPIILVTSDLGEVVIANKATKTLHTDIPKTIALETSNEYYALDSHGKRIPPQDLPRFRLLNEKEFHDFELTWITPKGSAPLVINGTLLPACFGHPPLGIMTLHDITALKTAENELRQIEAKFRILFESDLVGVVFGDIGGGMSELNDYFLNLIGYSREEVQGGPISWVQLTPPEYLHLDEKAMTEMKERGNCAPYEKPFIRKDGTWTWVMLTAIFIDESKFKHVAILIDVTDLKHTRDALQESENQLRLLTESVPQIIWTSFPDGTVEKYNQNWYRYTGLPTNTLPGKPWENVLFPDDVSKTVEAWELAQRSGKYVVEHRVQRKDGVYRWFLSRAIPYRDDSDRIIKWFGTSTDIEEQKQIQNRLEQERELREQFVNTLSHDLRNPMSAAKTSALLISRYPDRTDRIPSLAVRITDSLTRADRMIENLLDANRIRAGKGLPIEIAQCNLADVADKVCDELSTIHGNRFTKEFPHPIEGYWSYKDLHRLLENLLTNGLKYGYSHTPVTLGIMSHHSKIEISVHNFGEPIAPEDQKKLFEPFTRSKTAEGSEKKGWGLGLTLVRGVAEAHGGSVSVESSRQTGTTFRVILPIDARSKFSKN